MHLRNNHEVYYSFTSSADYLHAQGHTARSRLGGGAVPKPRVLPLLELRFRCLGFLGFTLLVHLKLKSGNYSSTHKMGFGRVPQ